MAFRGGALTRDRRGPGATPDAGDVRLAAGGDHAAFERLYHGHVARIHSLARRMVGAEEADEATQDVFVRAWEKLGTFRGEAAFGTWLHRLAINVLLGRRVTGSRRRDRFQEGEGIVQQLPSRGATPELYVDFEAAMERLPDGAREVFVLHDVEGFKHHEVAQMLGVTTGTTKAQLHRARMVLRRYIER
ncbi:MAG: sigma-70 family RNA polymerase sigma factor [Gemmatimonadales bacterium]|nr:sigma-70 family RNA polymerase sigma factor [Gemmatimonadales bacterium]NIN50104.1 sigma-70 family RNA polymerase sigma factor [Gemmatimonadales bacterium]NIP07568.1 sigma-70 family RNA polymerase sigma factor [Gemmatimonadales bacterium]NIR01724.1 sigma-70 family RNA polymerase sigma factor [Gemmatimonadales bacterium]NIS65627.1 sigma-70 family RNA polymerase sigma factor [Gemmatimonadales bacterium]